MSEAPLSLIARLEGDGWRSPTDKEHHSPPQPNSSLGAIASGSRMGDLIAVSSI
ncbi:MAG: hypothetical protein ACRC8Y_18690 [Chroococcales cyanobacterium]